MLTCSVDRIEVIETMIIVVLSIVGASLEYYGSCGNVFASIFGAACGIILGVVIALTIEVARC